ncbi:hypothetical protein [Chondrinema litorale]|uniref:hypothetical protein n=1 Tax=Chondrinema litorale TaxID=2994555 RepID=UPI0025436A46|nr:hypothetical protein [Chondrinema litorale]UZR99626.1 hypothetical protein OQ292_37185 [Chondrinema litorale]
MDNKDSRIYFSKNPYPSGHKIERFRWFAELKPSLGILFHFELESEDYNQGEEIEIPKILISDYEMDENIDPDPNFFWETKYFWFMHKRCIISSINIVGYNHFDDRIIKYSPYDGGVLVGTVSNKIDFNNLANVLIKADSLSNYDKKNSIKSHIMSCECVDHEIQIITQKKHQYDIYWKGKIAEKITGGRLDFCHSFKAKVSNVKFEGIYYPENLSNQELRISLAKYSINFDSIPLHKENFRMKNKNL